MLQNAPEFTNAEEASSAAAYLNSGFIEDTAQDLVDRGASVEEANKIAEKLRDFYSAYYSGDEDTMDKIAGEQRVDDSAEADSLLQQQIYSQDDH